MKMLGEILIENNYITQEQLDKVLKIQKENGGLLGVILIKLNYLTEEQLLEALNKQMRIMV